MLLAAFFDRLRETMRMRGLTWAELARQFVGDATISEWLRRGRVPLADIVLLPEVLNVNGNWLLTGQGPREYSADFHPDLYGLGADDVLTEVMRTLEELQERCGIRLAPAPSGESAASNRSPEA